MMDTLPGEVQEQILGFLPVSDLLAASRTCKVFRELFTSSPALQYLFHLETSHMVRRSPQMHNGNKFVDIRPAGRLSRLSGCYQREARKA